MNLQLGSLFLGTFSTAELLNKIGSILNSCDVLGFSSFIVTPNSSSIPITISTWNSMTQPTSKWPQVKHIIAWTCGFRFNYMRHRVVHVDKELRLIREKWIISRIHRQNFLQLKQMHEIHDSAPYEDKFWGVEGVPYRENQLQDQKILLPQWQGCHLTKLVVSLLFLTPYPVSGLAWPMKINPGIKIMSLQKWTDHY